MHSFRGPAAAAAKYAAQTGPAAAARVGELNCTPVFFQVGRGHCCAYGLHHRVWRVRNPPRGMVRIAGDTQIGEHSRHDGHLCVRVTRTLSTSRPILARVRTRYILRVGRLFFSKWETLPLSHGSGPVLQPRSTRGAAKGKRTRADKAPRHEAAASRLFTQY